MKLDKGGFYVQVGLMQLTLEIIRKKRILAFKLKNILQTTPLPLILGAAKFSQSFMKLRVVWSLERGGGGGG